MTEEELQYFQSLTYQPSAAVPWLQSLAGGDSMLGQDDQAYQDEQAYEAALYESAASGQEGAIDTGYSIGVNVSEPAADDSAYWDAYYKELALPQPYELPLAITPEAALADSEASLQQAISDMAAAGQPMTDAEMQSYMDSQAKQIVAAYPSTGTGIVQKLKDFGSNLTAGGGSSASAGSGGSTKAQIPVAATPAAGTAAAGSGISSTMMIALAALALVALLASSGHSRA